MAKLLPSSRIPRPKSGPNQRLTSLWILAASALILAGCSQPLKPGAVIRYRQIGACDGTAGVNAGDHSAFVLFQIVSIRNESDNTDFTFDPTKLFVTVSSHLSVPAPILSKLSAAAISAATVPHQTHLDFPPASYGVVTVGTSATKGAAEANKARFFLNYSAGAQDPPVFGEVLNLARKVWPYTPDCADIAPTLGQYAYADQAGEISTFKIDPAKGALTDLGKPVPDTFLSNAQAPGQFAIDPRGRFLFALESSGNVNEVLTYKINPGDGTLNAGNMVAALAGNYPFGLVIDPTGRFLYVETIDGVDAFQVDPTGGNLTKTGHIDADPESIAVDGAGSFLYVLSSPFTGETLAAYAINGSSGALNPVKNLAPFPVSSLGGLDFMTISPESGNLYIFDDSAQTVRAFQFDPTKPAFTELLPATPLPNEAFSLTFEPGGGFLYVLNGGDTVLLFGVSGTGALRPLATPTIVNSASVVSIVPEPTGRFLYMRRLPAQTLTGYTLNSSNGALAHLPGAPPTVYGDLTIPGTY